MAIEDRPHVVRSRRLEDLHAHMVAHLKAGLHLVAAAAELGVCDGEAYDLQQRAHRLGLSILEAGDSLTSCHPDLGGWQDALDSLRDDLDLFEAVLVERPQVRLGSDR